jgi:hypothetical protein
MCQKRERGAYGNRFAQIQIKQGLHAEKQGQSEGSIRGDRAPAGNNFTYAAPGCADGFSQSVLRNFRRFKKIFQKTFTRMNRRSVSFHNPYVFSK